MDFTKILCSLVADTKIKFTLYGKEITAEEAFAANGLLPAIAKRADHLCLLCLGYGIGITFSEDDNSVLGMKVNFDEVTPNALRTMYFYDVIMDIIEMSFTKDRVALDELMYD